MSNQGYALVGRVTCRVVPWLVRRQIAANRDKIVAAGVVLGVMAAGVALAHSDREA